MKRYSPFKLVFRNDSRLAFTGRTYIVLKNGVLPTIINDVLPDGTMRVKICQLVYKDRGRSEEP